VAEGLAERGPVGVTAERTVEAPKAEKEGPAHRRRFLLAYLVLGLLAGAAVAGGFALFSGAERVAGQDWSEWQPSGEESTYRDQIAAYVGRRYRMPSGNQLVGIVAGPPVVQDVTVRAVAIQQPNATSDEDIEVIPAEGSLMYVLCGLGTGCSIREGEPTQERHRLLRREALELSLYTFRYVDGIDSVIALLPPPPDTESNPDASQNATALFFEKRDFGNELDRPLAETLARTNAPAVTVTLNPVESIRIDRLTRPHLFSYQFQQLQEGSAVIVLAPIRATS
jgi:hypothetical protein